MSLPPSVAIDDPFARFRSELTLGVHWYIAALRAAGVWTTPHEVVRGRRLVYLVNGQALDLLLVIEQLVSASKGLRGNELTRLLFHGEPPVLVSDLDFMDALGAVNYKAYLNYFYGITVEEALLSAAEADAAKISPLDTTAGRGIYDRVYDRSLSELLAAFAETHGTSTPRRFSWPEHKSFTYWLFRYRMQHHVPPRVASDTRKALKYLRRLRAATGGSADPMRPDAERSLAYIESAGALSIVGGRPDG